MGGQGFFGLHNNSTMAGRPGHLSKTENDSNAAAHRGKLRVWAHRQDFGTRGLWLGALATDRLHNGVGRVRGAPSGNLLRLRKVQRETEELPSSTNGLKAWGADLET